MTTPDNGASVKSPCPYGNGCERVCQYCQVDIFRGKVESVESAETEAAE